MFCEKNQYPHNNESLWPHICRDRGAYAGDPWLRFTLSATSTHRQVCSGQLPVSVGPLSLEGQQLRRGILLRRDVVEGCNL
jgi:hypothetical protein